MLIEIKSHNYTEQPFGSYYTLDIHGQPPWEDKALKKNSATINDM
jgi:hypothetical protein